MWMVLHGFTGAPASWDPVVAASKTLSTGLRPALLGHDGSGADGAITFEAEVDRLLQIADALERPRCLCGYSMGARVALGMLMTAPSAFEAAVLIGVHPGLSQESDKIARRAQDRRWSTMLAEQGISTFVDAWERLPLFASQSTADAAHRHAQREVRQSHDALGLAQAMSTLGLAEMPDYGERIAALGIPVTLMAGALDEKFIAIARSITTSSPKANLEVVPESGHNLLVEAPAAVAATLDRVETHAQHVLGSAP